MGLEGLDMSSEEGAKEGIERIKNALTFVNSVRGQLGAYQNRLENTDARLDITEENMTAAYSRIMDVDMAEEMTEYTTQQVLTQAGISMLAQANERPQQVLQLLQ
jgi:flagellin